MFNHIQLLPAALILVCLLVVGGIVVADEKKPFVLSTDAKRAIGPTLVHVRDAMIDRKIWLYSIAANGSQLVTACFARGDEEPPDIHQCVARAAEDKILMSPAVKDLKGSREDDFYRSG